MTVKSWIRMNPKKFYMVLALAIIVIIVSVTVGVIQSKAASPAQSKGNSFMYMPNSDGLFAPYSTYNQTSDVCKTNCTNDSQCQAYSYKPSTNTCSLFSQGDYKTGQSGTSFYYAPRRS